MKRAFTIFIAILMIISMLGVLAPTLSLFAPTVPTPTPSPSVELTNIETAPATTPQ